MIALIKSLLLNTRKFFLMIAIVVLAMLAAALVLQYGFGFRPCIMCLYERVPYVLVVLVAAFSYWQKKPRPHVVIRCLFVLVLLFSIEVGLSAYHILIEQGVVQPTSSCNSGALAQVNSLEELQLALEQSMPSCDRPEVMVLGLSLAAWNLIIAMMLKLMLLWHYFYVIKPYLNRKR